MCKFSFRTFGYVKTPSVMLGVAFSDFDCIVFQARPSSVHAVKGSTAFSFLTKKRLTFEYSLETLHVPARSVLEQGRQHKQILYASAVNTSLVFNI